MCAVVKDSHEPNDTYTSATYLGTYTEGQSIPNASGTLHSSADLDRFYVYITESGNIFDWTMSFSVALSGAPGFHKLCIYYDRDCNGAVDLTKCASGTGYISVTTGDVDEAGVADDGCVDIEVSGDWSCTPYSLSFSLD
jgi:hypothetical protein